MTERLKNGRFKPGHSGNPGGRPQESAEVKELARQYSEEAINKLVEHLRGDNPKIAQSAAIALLDRGFGRPGQEIDVYAREEKPMEAVVNICLSHEKGDKETLPSPHTYSTQKHAFFQRGRDLTEKGSDQ